MKMDVVEFFSEFRRMCKSSSDCTKCQYHGNKCDNANEIFEKTVAVVEKWSREHPRKTRQDVFLEKYPEAELTKDGVVSICPIAVSAAIELWVKNQPPRIRFFAVRRWLKEMPRKENFYAAD